MGVATEHAELTVAVPAGWYRMPDPLAPDARIWPFELVGRFGFTGEDALVASASLDAALVSARAQSMPRRLRWVLLGQPPVPVVQAWALLDLVPRDEPVGSIAADVFERGAKDAGANGGASMVWHREVERRTVHGDPAVVIHDLLTIDQEPHGGRVVQHRALVAVFPERSVLVSLSVSTPLLAALPDVEAAALEIAEGVWIGERS